MQSHQVAISLTSSCSSSSSSSSSSSADDANAAAPGGGGGGGGRLRGARLLRAISRRQAREAEQAFRSSSTDSDSLSCSSGDDSPSDKDPARHSNGYRSTSCSSLHRAQHGGSSSNSSSSGGSSNSSGSDSGSGSGGGGMGSRAAAVARAFQSLGLAARSRSASSSPSNPPASSGKKRSKPQQSILRPPVLHAYVRGISGLPTQRVPRSYHAHCAAYNTASVCCRNA
ncbi:putative lysozyme-like protein [Bacillus rossius redtenbacheri]|uniref:putative lysozyme-like protein n=1 Tax=Bacillus rossius redtenbacheri TaxID=93214 RepID=UPI002FDD233E